MNDEEMVVVDENEASSWIQDKLIQDGIVVKKVDILKVVNLYYDYLETLGIVVDDD